MRTISIVLLAGAVPLMLLAVDVRAQSAAAAVSNSSPAISPDGHAIAFISNRSGSTDVYVVPADDGSDHSVTQTPEIEARPAWTADERVVFIVDGGERTTIYALPAAGGEPSAIGSVAGKAATVSPDGKRVAYMSGGWTQSRLAIANLDGTDERMLTSVSQTTVAWNMRFSPDGKQIAFTGQDNLGQVHIFVVGVDGRDFRQLTKYTSSEGRAQGPAWSPDGRQIAFQLGLKGSSRIWRVDADGSNPKQVTFADGLILDETPVWFPDGRRIAFQSTRSGRMEIWTANIDGSGTRQITGIKK